MSNIEGTKNDNSENPKTNSYLAAITSSPQQAKHLSESDEAALISREMIQTKIELDYDDLRDKALESYYDIKEYLDMRGSTLLNLCDFADLMGFCESVLEFPKVSKDQMNNGIEVTQENDEYFDDPAY